MQAPLYSSLHYSPIQFILCYFYITDPHPRSCPMVFLNTAVYMKFPFIFSPSKVLHPPSPFLWSSVSSASSLKNPKKSIFGHFVLSKMFPHRSSNHLCYGHYPDLRSLSGDSFNVVRVYSRRRRRLPPRRLAASTSTTRYRTAIIFPINDSII